MDVNTAFKSRFETFMNQLPTAGIKFIYFNGDSDNLRPYIKLKLKQYSRSNRDTVYISDSVNKDGAYVYKESAIKYIVQYNPINFKVLYYQQDPYGDVFHGDHITFLVIPLRNNNDVLIQTHKTLYFEDTNGIMRRDRIPCNFTISRADFMNSQNILSFDMFKNIQCKKNLSNTNPELLADINIDESEKKVIHTLTEVAMGLPATLLSGGKLKEYKRYNSRNYLVRVDNGKVKRKYIVTKNKKIYIDKIKKQKIAGGAPKFDLGLSFDKDVFLDFINESIIMPIAKLNDELNKVLAFYDEDNQLGKNNDFFSLLFEYENHSFVFKCKLDWAFAACYLNEQSKIKKVEELSDADNRKVIEHKNKFNQYVAEILKSLYRISKQ